MSDRKSAEFLKFSCTTFRAAKDSFIRGTEKQQQRPTAETNLTDKCSIKRRKYCTWFLERYVKKIHLSIKESSKTLNTPDP